MLSQLRALWNIALIRIFKKKWNITISRGDELEYTISSENIKNKADMHYLEDLNKMYGPEIIMHLLSEGEIHIVFLDKNNRSIKKPLKVHFRRK
jgi:hypothetical protein